MTQASPELRAANRRGMLAVTAGAACFVVNDTLTKHVSESLPTSQLIAVRGLMATVLVFAIAHAIGATKRMRDLLDRRVMARTAMDIAGSIAYLVALFNMPFADASAINMSMPLTATLLAVLILGEKVRPARWLLIGLGFTGVMLVVQPTGAGFTPYALLCLASTVLMAIRDFSTRLIDQTIPSLLVTLSTTIGVTLTAFAWGLVQHWQPMSVTQIALLAAASVFVSGAYYLFTVAMRGGEMSIIAPFRYSGIVFALVAGYVVWGTIPNTLALIGIALIAGAGLGMLRK